MDIDVSKLSTNSQFKVDQLYVLLYLNEHLSKPGFKGFAKSVSSTDESGPFDILPGHENFVTVFSKKIEIVPTEGDRLSFEAKTGVLEVSSNVVRVFLDR